MRGTILAIAMIVTSAVFGPPPGSPCPCRPAPVATPPAPQERIASLVRQLGADSAEARDKAQAALRALGATAEPQLWEGLNSTSFEVRMRCRFLLAELQAERVLKQVDASTFTGKYERTPLTKILADLTERTGNVVRDIRREQYDPTTIDPILDLTFDKTPFWEAVDRIAAAAGVRDDVHRGQMVALVPGKPVALPTCYDGPLRFQILRVAVHRDITTGQGWLEVAVAVAWEPRLRPLVLAFQRQPTVAADSRGRSLTDPAERGYNALPVGEKPTIATTFILRLRPPAAGAEKLATLVGRCQIRLPAKQTTYRFGQLKAAEPQTQSRDSVTVALESFRQEKDRWIARVWYKYPGGEEHQSHRTWQDASRVRLVRQADGKVFDVGTVGDAALRPDGEQVFEYRWAGLAGDPDAYELVITIPTLIVTRAATYRFGDVPLP